MTMIFCPKCGQAERISWFKVFQHKPGEEENCKGVKLVLIEVKQI